VKTPANRTGFKIVRDANQEEGGLPRRRRRAQNTDSSLMSITLPADTTEEDAEVLFEQFGLSEEKYEIARDEAGVYLKRKQVDDTVETTEIQLPNGITAVISKAAFDANIQRSEDHPSIAVTKITFTNINRADAEDWLTDKDISFNAEDLFELGSEQVYVRYDTPESAKIKNVQIEENITATITQTRSDDIPQRMYRGIVEQAYGQYGWGHVDFLQAMADEIFSQDSDNAIWWLRRVLDEIVFYSGLPLEDRLALMQNAVGEFLAWMSSLMQALPRSVISTEDRVDLSSQSTGDESTDADGSTNSSTVNTKETADMVVKTTTKTGESDKATDDQTVTRTDDQVDAEQEQTTTDEVTTAQRSDANSDDVETEEEVQDEEITIRRSALEKHLSKGAVSTIVEEQTAQRDDGGNGAIMGAINEMGLNISKRMDKMDERITAIGGETVVRSDGDVGDGEVTDEDDDDAEEVQRTDPYRNAFLSKRTTDKLYRRG